MPSDIGDDYSAGLEPTPKQPTLDGDSPLRRIAANWLKNIEAARKAKRVFDADAAESMRFFDGGQKYLFDAGWRGQGLMSRPIPAPAFRMSVNRVFEAVKLLGAVIYNRNPNRTVTPRKFPVIPPDILGISPDGMTVDPMSGMPMPDPAAQMYMQTSQAVGMQESAKQTQAKLLEAYLNFTPLENDLKLHSRLAVDEGIIKGGGVLWTEALEYPNVPPAEPTMTVGSFSDSVDNLLLDPDAQTIEEITWCAKRCYAPIDMVARQYGLTRDDLRKHLESFDEQARAGDTDPNNTTNPNNNKRRAGKTNEIVCYYKIWSKCGFGDRLKSAKKEDRGLFDPLGDYAYIVVAEGLEYPLNVPPSVLNEQPDQDGVPQSMRARAAWPIPFWADRGGWPFSMIAFHRKPNSLWPISHIKPGISELRFVNWCMSFLAQRISISCETLIGVSKAADQDLKQQILAPSECGFKIVEISEALGRNVNEIISIFQQPGVSQDIWQICNAAIELFDKRVGLTELTYGLTRASLRSATEAQVKSDQISIRPDDMAEQVENWQTQIARKEAMAARWLLRGTDVASVLGPLGAEAWDRQLASNTDADVSAVAREFDYRVEAGTTRKPNKGTRIQQANEALQVLGPMLQQVAASGNVQPFNTLLSYWADVNDFDASGMLLPPPPPPAPPIPSGVSPGATSSPPAPESRGGGGAAQPEPVA